MVLLRQVDTLSCVTKMLENVCKNILQLFCAFLQNVTWYVVWFRINKLMRVDVIEVSLVTVGQQLKSLAGGW